MSTAHLTRTTVRHLTWTVETDVELTNVPQVAFLPVGSVPDALTTWLEADWAGDDEVLADGHHRRSMVALVGGPDSGVEVPLPAGESVSWLRLSTDVEQIEQQAGIITVGPTSQD